MMMFNTPRVRSVGFAAAAFFVGLAFGNYDVTKGSVDHVADQYGQAKKQVSALKSVAGCQEKRAAVLSGQVMDLAGAPNCASVRSVPSPSAK